MTVPNPLLSIIIPAFNSERFLTDAIASARQQTVQDIEIIVVDDGSTDGTDEIIQRHAGDGRMKAFRQENLGPSGARNAGLRLARGEYVGFLDADDRWLPSKAERHLEELRRHSDLDLTFSWWRIIDEEGRTTGRRGTPPPGRVKLESLLKENCTGTASTLVGRKRAIASAGGFDENLQSNVDLVLLLRIAELRPNNIGCIPEVLTEYRRHGCQITSDWTRMNAGWRQVLEKTRKRVPDRVAGVEREASARQARYLAFLAFESGDYRSARRLVREAWKAHPVTLAFDRRAWLTTAAVATTVFPSRFSQSFINRMRNLRAAIFDRRS